MHTLLAPAQLAPGPPARPPAVLAEGLYKRYPGAATDAVAGIDLEIRAGEVFGLLGPNGAGKSTTLGVITTRVRPTAGRVRVAGIDVGRDPVAVKRVLGVVAQHPTLDRALTAAQNLSFHGAYFGLSRAQRRARTATLLTRFGLDEHAGKRIDALSGGLAQRLMIARALVHEPVVLVLDEPTTGLDPEARRFVWEQSRRLRAEGVTQLLSTHDMHEAEALCDRVAIVDRGVVLACGAPDALRSSLGTAPVLELGVRTRADPGPAFAALGSPSVTRAGDGEWSVALAGEDATAALGAAHAAGLQVTALRRRRPSLEDVFFSLTRRTLE